MTIFDQQIELLGSKKKRVWSFTSLIFSTFYFAPHWASNLLNSTQAISLSVLIYLVFVISYCATIVRPIVQGQWFLLTFIMLSVVGIWHNPGAAIFLGFAAFVIGYYGSVRTSLLLVIMMLVAIAISANLGGMFNTFTLVPAFASSIGLFGFGLLERRSTIQAKQQQRSEEAIEKLSALAERERIGRDLHDSVGHSLSAIALKAELAEKRLAKQQIDKAREDLNELSAMARNVLSDVRKAVSGMQKRGLIAELHKLQALLESKGLTVQLSLLTTTNDLMMLTDSQESELTLIAKELVTNVIKHSDASVVELWLMVENQQICLKVTDNGSINNVKEGNGLKGMRDRLHALQGELVISIASGLTALASVPIKQRGAS